MTQIAGISYPKYKIQKENSKISYQFELSDKKKIEIKYKEFSEYALLELNSKNDLILRSKNLINFIYFQNCINIPINLIQNLIHQRLFAFL